MCPVSIGQSDYLSNKCGWRDATHCARLRKCYTLRLMSLNAQQKDALAFQLLELVNHDEPNARPLRTRDAVARVRLELVKSQLSRNPT